ncbi:hypothetical protein [Kineosporia sp. NBRC 101731]|uniref:hypothetical protein n=1 Tax=Kineosporia sp. NBRC 101731 TaxID=3032199 RepID=UPI0024A461FF|nr:hypothetical protein [Kineosporia sp. NBRC 101731]GLY27187.1 hypothetical protein Kisp02_05520 [Kineosporia sp. NBRC 101731]
MFTLRKSAAGIVAAAALVGPLALVATPASAQTVPSCDVRPRGTTFLTRPKTIDFDVPSARHFTFDLPEIGLYIYDTSVDGDASVARVDPKKLDNADARWHMGTVERERSDGTTDTCTGTWRLKRGTRIEITKVQKIRYGRKVTGTLERVNWGKNPKTRWTTYSNQEVDIQFVNARGQWQYGGRVPVKNGTFTFTKQIGERTWRAYFQGTNISGSDYSSEVTG